MRGKGLKGLSAAVLLAALFASLGWAIDPELERKHQQLLYPSVKISAAGAGGSGTIIWSAPLRAEDNSVAAATEERVTVQPRSCATFILTNHHVIDGAITVTEEYDPSLNKKRLVEKRELVQVQMPEYASWSERVGAFALDAEIVLYSKRKDLALLSLRSERCMPHVARLIPRGTTLYTFQPVTTVGAALGYDPIPNEGVITLVRQEFQGDFYIMHSAHAIWGNSGGGLFLTETGEFTGVPARIEFARTFFSAFPMTNMTFAIPMETVYGWWEEEDYDWLWGLRSYDEAMAAREKRIKREREREVQ